MMTDFIVYMKLTVMKLLIFRYPVKDMASRALKEYVVKFLQPRPTRLEFSLFGDGVDGGRSTNTKYYVTWIR